MSRIYFDYNATSPLRPEAARAMADAASVWGNPSSIHEEGRAARDLVEAARRGVAALVGAAADQVVFTSGGTEADALGLVGLAERARAAGRPARVAVSGVEHPAVTGAVQALVGRGFEVDRLPVDGAGRIDPDAVAAAAPTAALVALQLANHETGVVQEVAALTAVARTAGALVHCDAVQAVGKRPVSFAELAVDAMAVSAHKLGGPKGIGALVVRGDLPPLAGPGHQERGRRPGTENLLGIAGFGAAAEAAAGDDPAPIRAAAELLEAGLVDLGARIHGAGAPRLTNTVNAAFDGAPGEVLVAALDLAGVAASTGAACSSGTLAPSPVLLAMGQPEARAREAIRFSLGPGSSADEARAVLELLPAIVERARRFS